MMRTHTREQWLAIRAEFDRLVDLEATERETRLAKVAPEIAEEVRSLLAATGVNGILDDLAVPSQEPSAGYSSLSSGAEVGAFRIERLIGRGGMGEVYLATRTDEAFEQRVALKLLRPEAAERGAMFDAERRLLAALEHPGIARLIDGGLAPDGRPYMALEYVEGRSITAWCAAHHADLADRLRLFLEVCEAVAYAHARLVVHQDIKPSNILVDGDGRARLLDFGVARILEDSAGDHTLTQMLLTPDYAAPEQLERRMPTIATDIYSLGAVLFELVAGRGPWRAGDTHPSALHRLIHDDPPPPSQAAAGQPDPPVQPKQIAGDLDAIISKAMRREPADRYASVGDFAADIRRHLAHEPVAARRGTSVYVARRFVQRHRWGVAASIAALAVLLAGAGGIVWQARKTAIERDMARAEAKHSDAVNQAIALMFADTADRGTGADTSAKDMLDQSTKRLVATFDPNASNTAPIVRAMAELYVQIEDPAAAQGLVKAALDRGVARADPVEHARLVQMLGNTYVAMSQFDKATPLLAEASRVWATDPARFRNERLDAVAARAQMMRLQGDRDGAIKLIADNMPEVEQAYASDSRELLTRYANFAIHLVEANRLPEADAILTKGEALAKRSGEENTAAGLAILQMRGAWDDRMGKPDAALAVYRRAVDLRRALYGPSAGLAVGLLYRGREELATRQFAPAAVTLGEAVPMAKQYLGPFSQPYLMINLGRAEALASSGELVAAEQALADAQPALRPAGPVSLMQGAYLKSRALVELKQGKRDAATQSLDAADAIFGKIGAPAAPYVKASKQVRQQITASH